MSASPRIRLSLQAFFCMPSMVMLFDLLRLAAGRHHSTSPATRLGKLLHIIADIFGNGLDSNREKTDAMYIQSCKVTDIADDTVKTVYNDRLKLTLLRRLHHFLERRAIQIATGETLIVYDKSVNQLGTVMRADVFFAKFNLIALSHLPIYFDFMEYIIIIE